MKKVYLVRHAKSDWGFDVDDFDRPLNDRGKKDAPMMAERLLKKKVEIDAFVSSPAKRALRTARYFAEAFRKEDKDIIQMQSLYLPAPAAIYEAIEGMDDAYQSIAIFTHNNGITDFANSLGIIRIDNMPTCSILGLTVDTPEWKKFRKAEKGLLFFDYPKLK